MEIKTTEQIRQPHKYEFDIKWVRVSDVLNIRDRLIDDLCAHITTDDLIKIKKRFEDVEFSKVSNANKN